MLTISLRGVISYGSACLRVTLIKRKNCQTTVSLYRLLGLCALRTLIGYYITAPSARLPRHFAPRNDNWRDTHTRIKVCLERTYYRYLLIRSFESQGDERISAELASHTRLLATIVTRANCLLFALVLLFSFTQKTALPSYISHFRSLVFCVWKPCGCSTSEPTSVVFFRWRTSGITSEMSLSMRVPLSPPRAMNNIVEKCP